MTTPPRSTPGEVYLVGSGPGDPGLVTWRAVECLQRADIVLYDYLANPAVLKHACVSAELVCLGHHGTGRLLAPDEIIARMLDEAQRGKTVVRLKGSDPSIFGRGGDETEALRGAGIPFEIVPGITTALAVAAFCEIPITHHEDASAVALITGQERHDKAAPCLDYGALAKFPGTLVFYMGVTSAAQWSGALIEHGKPPETPVAIIRRCTWTQQQAVRCTLGTVAETVRRQGLRPPAVFVVGKVVDRAPRLAWFAARPLFGQRVLVIDSPGTSQNLRDRLAALGVDVIARPAIQITDPPDWAPVDVALNRLAWYDWLIFTSGSEVEHFFRRLFEQGGDLRRLGCPKLAAGDSGAAERLAHYHLRADMATDRFPAESLAQELAGQAEGRRFLLVGSSPGWQTLADELRERRGHVDQIVVCDSVGVADPDSDVARALQSDEIDWITVTSPAAARSLAWLYGDALRRTRLASIGPLTSETLRDLGHEPAAEASPQTMAGLVDAIRQRSNPQRPAPEAEDAGSGHGSERFRTNG